MAAGLGFKDFATGEVLTANDVDGYLMQGVWVFASAAARDSAVTSPQEGNFAYLKDTNVTTYYTGSAWANLDTTGMTNPMTTTGDTIYSSSGSTPARLGIGTANQQLRVNSGATAPEWFTPAVASSALTLIDSHSFTTSAAISRNSVFSATYQNYMIVVEGLCASNAEFRMRLRVSGTDATAANYVYGLILRSSTALSSGYDGAGTTWEAGYFGTETSVTVIYVNDPFNATKTSYTAHSGAITTDRPLFLAGGGHNLATSYDGFTLSAGGNDLTGTVRTYGLAN
jgi:hypothetical protein